MFETFPNFVSSVMDWSWDEFDMYYKNLMARTINEASVDRFMTDWTTFSNMLGELRSRLHVATTVDTTDEEADARYKRFMSEIQPKAMQANFELSKKLVDSGIIPDNSEVPMRNLHATIDLFREENLPLITREGELGIAYNKVIGAQTVEWDGEEVTLTSLAKVYQEQDRERREEAWKLAEDRRQEDVEALDEIWRELMDIRRQKYENAGLRDYREYAWKDRNRHDYTPDDVLQFVDAIEQVVVPAFERLNEQRREKMGVDSLRPWDTSVDPQGREPLTPFKTVNEFEMRAEAIFNQVNPELGTYFRTMRQEQLLDLGNRNGKAPGGYCTAFPVAQRPFIFMNAVGVERDVRTLLHEAGHAFHGFESMKSLDYSIQRQSPMEFNEVASMAMELLAAPYIDRQHGGYFDAEESNRFRANHLKGIINLWAYIAVVVALQHWIYTNHDKASDPAAVEEKWVELWERFMKGIDYSGVEHGIKNRWRHQLHIFRVPFYYVEYGLAQLGAVQVWANALQDQESALLSYLDALRLGGTVTLPQLYETAGARLAFDEGMLRGAVNLIEKTVNELENA